MALYFDDVSMVDQEVVYARDATESYIKGNLQPGTHVGIFTATGEPELDFTDSRERLHDALFRVRSSPRKNSLQGCPELSDYEAQEIVDHPDPRSGADAWRVAIDVVNAYCPVGPEKFDIDTVPIDVVIAVRDRARSVAAQAEFRAKSSLAGLKRAVDALSQVPGKRSLIMVSPGFLSSTLRPELDEVIKIALHSEVVISSIDPKGMFMLSNQKNAGRDSVPWGTAQRNRLASDLQGEHSGSSVLEDVAEATGGQYLHDNNDLSADFRSLTDLRGSYILAFAPSDLNLDGRFHRLKISLRGQRKGVRLRVRRGYFANREDLKQSNFHATLAPASE